ncbi:acyl-CoA N-acyltransferase [Cytidiella melzeri]|nr:acyl-CoA N-acyltransferase [Cytidiella melzeri]
MALEQYSPDIHFCFPIRPLTSNKVTLVPFNPDLHSQTFFEIFSRCLADEYRHSTIPVPFGTVTELTSWYEREIWSHADRVLFAVFNNHEGEDSATHRQAAAGFIGLTNAVVDDVERSAEVAYLVTHPLFQRTHVTSHAVGLLLMWCFDEMRFDKVDWYADEQNERACQAAERMGFKKEAGKSSMTSFLGIDVRDFALQVGRQEKGGKKRIVHLVMARDEWQDGRRILSERMGKP